MYVCVSVYVCTVPCMRLTRDLVGLACHTTWRQKASRSLSHRPFVLYVCMLLKADPVKFYQLR